MDLRICGTDLGSNMLSPNSPRTLTRKYLTFWLELLNQLSAANDLRYILLEYKFMLHGSLTAKLPVSTYVVISTSHVMDLVAQCIKKT